MYIQIGFIIFCQTPSRVIFTTDDGVTCVCAAGEVEVAFEDLFQPIPLPKVSQQVKYDSHTESK